MSDEEARNLICTIARGAAIDHTRKNKVIQCDIDDKECEKLIASVESFNSVEIRDAMNAALAEREQDIISLKYTYGFSYQEIGDMYGIGKSRVSQIIKIAAEKLAKELRVEIKYEK